MRPRTPVLPLSPTSKAIKIALIGANAMSPVVHGGGSGSVVPSFVPTPYDSIRNALGLKARDHVTCARDLRARDLTDGTPSG